MSTTVTTYPNCLPCCAIPQCCQGRTNPPTITAHFKVLIPINPFNCNCLDGQSVQLTNTPLAPYALHFTYAGPAPTTCPAGQLLSVSLFCEGPLNSVPGRWDIAATLSPGAGFILSDMLYPEAGGTCNPYDLVFHPHFALFPSPVLEITFTEP